MRTTMPVGDRDGARRHRLALALDLDQALPAGADRIEQRVVAEPRDLDAHQLGGPNHQRALGHTDSTSSMVRSPSRPAAAHRASVRSPSSGTYPLRWPSSIEACGSNGQPPSRCATYSSRKYLIDDMIGLAAPSPNAQNDFPKMVSEMSSSFSRSSSVPAPGLQALVDLRQPVGALPARRALAAGLVRVELRPAPHRAHHAGGLVEDLQRLGAQHRADCRPYPRNPVARRDVRRSAAVSTIRPASRTSASVRPARRRRSRAVRAA